jgi:hypothetical protein
MTDLKKQNGEKTVGQLFDYRPFKVPSKVNAAFATNVAMGLELEVERYPHQSEADSDLELFWRRVRDGSLRNNGIEFVSRHPVSGKRLLEAINILCDHLRLMGVTNDANLSHRCSLHTHIDFIGRTVDEVLAFVCLFILLEPSLYTVSGKERYSNIYCPGFSQAAGALYQVGRAMETRELTGLITTWSKYSACNVIPLHAQGSIEIRIHKGSVLEDDIVSWIRILNHLYAACIGETPESIIEASTREPVEVVTKLFPLDLVDAVLCDNLEAYWPSVQRNLFQLSVTPLLYAEDRAYDFSSLNTN